LGYHFLLNSFLGALVRAVPDNPLRRHITNAIHAHQLVFTRPIQDFGNALIRPLS
jgi:hypothetical protein